MLPDWGHPLDIDGTTGFAADGRVLVLPEALVLARDPDGLPDFRLSAVRPVLPREGDRGHGRLEMGLALVSRRATADGRVAAAPALRGWLWLAAQALDLPEALRAPVKLGCTGTGAVALSLPLRPEGLGFVERMLAEGALPVLARAELEVAGIARRVPGRAVVDLAPFLAALDAMTPEALRAALLRDPAALGVTLDSADPMAAEAAADHLRAVLCEGPLRAGATGLLLAPRPDLSPQGRAVLDLSQPVMATRIVALQLDPFAAARALSGGASLIHRVTTAPLQSGQHRVTLAANLPLPLVGPLAVGARLVLPPRPPARPHEIREEVEFAEGRSVDRILRLAPTEPLAWQVEAAIWWPTPDGRGAELRHGSPRQGEGPEVDLSPGDFPMAIARVAASPALLRLAGVAVTTRAAGLTARAVLSTARPAVALALPQAGLLSAEVLAPDGRRIDLPSRPAGDWRIELADLPGYGPRQLVIRLAFPPGLALRAIDLRGGEGPVQTLAFTPAQAERRFDWFCADPFGPGLAWRWHDAGGAFSPVGGDRLDLQAGAGVEA